MLQRAIEGLVALGVPGLILAVAISVSGFTGAAAITTALAVLGGPFGMLGGISVLLLLVLVSKVIAKHGISRIVPAVIKGLIAKEESQESIQSKIRGIPQWIISSKLRDEIQQVINQNTKTLTARSSS